MIDLTTERVSAFWKRVDRREGDECWPWLGAQVNGYGRFYFSRRCQPAHRFSFEIEKGDIPAGLVIDHKCRVRHCVNPRHLRAVTNKTNVLENSESVTAYNSVKTHCLNGHPLAGQNLIIRGQGWRGCRACKNAWSVQYKNKRRRSLKEPTMSNRLTNDELSAIIEFSRLALAAAGRTGESHPDFVLQACENGIGKLSRCLSIRGRPRATIRATPTPAIATMQGGE